MKHKTKVSKEKRELIIKYFYTHHDNTDQTIADYFGLRRMTVSDIIADHLKEKMKRINKRVNDEPKQNN